MTIDHIVAEACILIDNDETLGYDSSGFMWDAIEGGMSKHDAALMAVGYVWDGLLRHFPCCCATSPETCLHNYLTRSHVMSQVAQSLEDRWDD